MFSDKQRCSIYPAFHFLWRSFICRFRTLRWRHIQRALTTSAKDVALLLPKHWYYFSNKSSDIVPRFSLVPGWPGPVAVKNQLQESSRNANIFQRKKQFQFTVPTQPFVQSSGVGWDLKAFDSERWEMWGLSAATSIAFLLPDGLQQIYLDFSFQNLGGIKSASSLPHGLVWASAPAWVSRPSSGQRVQQRCLLKTVFCLGFTDRKRFMHQPENRFQMFGGSASVWAAFAGFAVEDWAVWLGLLSRLACRSASTPGSISRTERERFCQR